MPKLTLGGTLVGAAVGLLVLAVVLAALDQGWIAGVTLAVAIVGAITSFWKPALRKPRLKVTMLREGRSGERFEVVRENELRPLDMAPIEAHASRIATDTVAPHRPRRDDVFTGTESYARSQQRFENELSEFQAEFRAWLQEYHSLQWPQSSYFAAHLRLQNTGDAAAENVKVRLFVPDGLFVADAKPSIGPPPTPPTFERRGIADVRLVPPTFNLREKLFGPDRGQALGALSGPTLVREDGLRVFEFGMQSLGHGVQELSAHEVRLYAREPGTYELRWEAHANNLSKAAGGVVTLDVLPQPRSEEPVTDIGTLMATNFGLVE